MWIVTIFVGITVFLAGILVGVLVAHHKQKAKTEITPDSTDAGCATCAHNKDMLRLCEKHSAFLDKHTEEQKVFIDNLLKRQVEWLNELDK